MTTTRRPDFAEPRCATCSRELNPLPDWSGRGRAMVVCFDCDPPEMFCEACAKTHRTCRRKALARPADSP